MHTTLRIGLALTTALVLSTVSVVSPDGGIRFGGMAIGTPLAAQSKNPNVAERYTFVAPGAPKGVVDPDRLQLVLTRWSTDDERDKVMQAAEAGSEKVLDALRGVGSVGYIRWPGGLEYSLKYARRTTRPDGGADVVLITDRPLWAWWDSSVKLPATGQPYGVIQLRMDKSGKGEGRLTVTNGIKADKASGLVIADFAQSPALMTDVQRDTRS